VTARGLGLLLLLGGVAALAGVPGAPAQEPAPPPAPAQESASRPQPPKKLPPHSHDLRILGTVFTPEGFSFRGVPVRVRRAGEKKFRWMDTTNSLGEFAFWLPPDLDYELVVQVRGFVEQTRPIEGKSGERFMRLSLQMQRTPGGDKK